MANNPSQSHLSTLQSAVPAKYGVSPYRIQRVLTLASGSQTLYPADSKILLYPAGGAAATITFTAAALSQLNMSTGDVLTFDLINDSANTCTVAPAATVTASGVTGAAVADTNVTTGQIRRVFIVCTSSVGTAANPNGLYTLYI